MVLSAVSEGGEKGSSELEKAEKAYIQSKRCSGRECLFWQTDEREGSVNGETMKFRNSEIIEELREVFSKIDTSEWEGAEKLQLCVTFGWDKNKVKRSKR